VTPEWKGSAQNPASFPTPLAGRDQGWESLRAQALAFICVLIDFQTPTPDLPTKGREKLRIHLVSFCSGRHDRGYTKQIASASQWFSSYFARAPVNLVSFRIACAL
jgi:hypothetical protein